LFGSLYYSARGPDRTELKNLWRFLINVDKLLHTGILKAIVTLACIFALACRKRCKMMALNHQNRRVYVKSFLQLIFRKKLASRWTRWQALSNKVFAHVDLS